MKLRLGLVLPFHIIWAVLSVIFIVSKLSADTVVFSEYLNTELGYAGYVFKGGVWGAIQWGLSIQGIVFILALPSTISEDGSSISLILMLIALVAAALFFIVQIFTSESVGGAICGVIISLLALLFLFCPIYFYNLFADEMPWVLIVGVLVCAVAVGLVAFVIATISYLWLMHEWVLFVLMMLLLVLCGSGGYYIVYVVRVK